MKTNLLPAYFKKLGYISLIVAVSAYFLITSGLLYYFVSPKTVFYFKQFSLYTFLFSLFSIGFSADPKGQSLTGNKLLLPHYFKIIGYIFLVITLILCILIKTKRFNWHQSVTTTFIVPNVPDEYQAEMSDRQKKSFLKIEDREKVEVQSTVIINSISLILPIGLLFIAFSKEKIEDELITSYRAQSLQLAILLLFFLILYQKLNVPEVETVIVSGDKNFGYFDLPGRAWKADVLINVILIFGILKMEYMLRIKPFFNKTEKA